MNATLELWFVVAALVLFLLAAFAVTLRTVTVHWGWLGAAVLTVVLVADRV